MENIISNETVDRNKQIKYRLVNEITIRNLCDRLNLYDFTEVRNENDCDVAIKKLTSIIDECYKSCCPLKTKTVSPKDITKPWITADIKSKMKRRNNYYSL